MTGTCILFDASNVLHRSYHADAARQEGGLTAPDGTPTGALLGWYRTLLRFREVYQPELMVAVFDGGVQQARYDACPDYKANRTKKYPGLPEQMEDAYQSTPLFGIPSIKMPQTEADDIIGAIAKKWGGERVYIVSDDKDLGQCVNEKVHQIKSPKNGDWRICGVKEVEDHFGVSCSQVAAFLAITGDSSDNIPGLPKVGPVTAVKWLKKFGDIESLIKNADSVEPTRFSKVITENADSLRKYLTVTTLHEVNCEVPRPIAPNHAQLSEYLSKRGLKSIAARFDYLESRQQQAGAQISAPPEPAVSPLAGGNPAPAPTMETFTQGVLF